MWKDITLTILQLLSVKIVMWSSSRNPWQLVQRLEQCSARKHSLLCNLNADEVSMGCSNIRPQGQTASLVLWVSLFTPALNEKEYCWGDRYWVLNHCSAYLRWKSITMFCLGVLSFCRKKKIVSFQVCICQNILANTDLINILVKT